MWIACPTIQIVQISFGSISFRFDLQGLKIVIMNILYVILAFVLMLLIFLNSLYILNLSPGTVVLITNCALVHVTF